MVFDDIPSKTQRKRDMHALQKLGVALARLSPERIRSLDIPEPLQRALLESKSMHAHGALRRQMQYIGRLMRDVDPAPLQARLEDWQAPSRQAVAMQHQAERWRDRMLEDLSAVDEFVAEFKAADRQQLRLQAQAARRERDQNTPPRQYRELFRSLLQTLTESSPS